MANRVVSIDIGSAFTRVAEVDYKKKNPGVYSCFSFPTPEGSVDDGQIVDAPLFAEELKKGMAENGIKTKKAVFSITSSKIANREVTVPKVKEKSLGPLVTAKASEYFPVDMSQYQVAYTPLEETEDNGRKQLRMLMLAASKELLESYYTLAKEANLSIEALDYSGNSILPVLKSEVSNEVTLIIKIDEATSLLTVLNNKVVALQRNITYGADTAIDEVMSADTMGATPYDDAVKLLRMQKLIGIEKEEPKEEEPEPEKPKSLAESLGFDPDGEAETAKTNPEADERNLRRKKLIENVTESLDMLMGSITRVIDYYNSRNSDNPITKYVLTGMGGDFKGMDDLLAEATGGEVVVLSSTSSAKLSKTVKKISIGEYIGCFGAAIAPMDLIPVEHDKKKQAAAASKGGKSSALSLGSVNQGALGYLLLAGGVIVSAVLIVLSILPYNQAMEKNSSLNTQLNSLMPIVDVYNQYMDKSALYNEVDALYQLTNTRNEGLRDFVAELEGKLPSRTIVTAFSSDGTVANMSFKCASKQDAVNLINNMRSFESLASINVSALSETTDVENMLTEVTFSITCTYRQPEPVSLNEIGNGSSDAYAGTDSGFEETVVTDAGNTGETVGAEDAAEENAGEVQE